MVRSHALIARNTLLRGGGEIVAKLATVAFFVVMARELGSDQFGDFVFGLSLSQVLLGAAGLGTDEYVIREVARDRGRAGWLFSNVVGLKVLMLAGLMAVIAGVLAVGGYPLTTAVAVILVGVGVATEVVTKSYYAVFQGYERMEYVAVALIAQRVATAAIGITVLLAGGDLIAAGAAFALASVLGLVVARVLLHRITRPSRTLERDRWGGLIRTAAPLGFVALLLTLLLKLDASLLSFLKGGGSDNEVVGFYGAAYRLVEATLFISFAFGTAVLPWLSRHGGGAAGVTLARGYELGLKGLIAVLVPIGLVYGLFAEPLIELFYGSGYEDAIAPLRLLAAMTVLYGINAFAATLLIARDKPGAFVRPGVAIVVQNVVFNLILIPPFGAEGAAFNAVLSSLLLAGITFWRARSLVGGVSLARVLIAPAVAGLALAAVAVAGQGVPLVAGAVGLAAYAATFLLVERLAFDEDFDLYRSLVRRRSAEPVPVSPSVGP